ncbi:MAG: GNAT family N-acetyltransferase, partial [Actinomycetota bacterium]|nr:GNAT family N-acetyltransferase [Actinomycetota bacterium]
MGGKGGGGSKKKRGRKPERMPGVSPPFLGKPPFFGRGIGMAEERGIEKKKGEEEYKPKKNIRDIEIPSGGKIIIENYYPPERLEKLLVDDGICMFSRNNPDRQKRALIAVSRLEGSNVICGVHEGKLISYIAIHHPSEMERWGKPGYPWLFELGAIAVSRNYRRMGLAGAMLDVAFDDHFYDDKIVFATGFTWHWDLE